MELPPETKQTEAKAYDSSDDEDQNNQFQFKVILLGDGAVGKTSIATRFTQEHFHKSYKQTIGLDLFLKRLKLPGNVEVTTQVWDIGGQTIGGSMIGNYIYGAHAILFCYDITNYYSFQNLEDWMRLVKRTFANSRLPYMALVANKHDLVHMRAVKIKKHNQFADENDLYSYEMSAKTGDGVHNCFFQIAADLCGVVLTKPDLQVATMPVKANIVDYQQNDPEVEEPKDLRQAQSRCTIQ